MSISPHSIHPAMLFFQEEVLAFKSYYQETRLVENQKQIRYMSVHERYERNDRLLCKILKKNYRFVLFPSPHCLLRIQFSESDGFDSVHAPIEMKDGMILSIQGHQDIRISIESVQKGQLSIITMSASKGFLDLNNCVFGPFVPDKPITIGTESHNQIVLPKYPVEVPKITIRWESEARSWMLCREKRSDLFRKTQEDWSSLARQANNCERLLRLGLDLEKFHRMGCWTASRFEEEVFVDHWGWFHIHDVKDNHIPFCFQRNTDSFLALCRALLPEVQVWPKGTLLDILVSLIILYMKDLRYDQSNIPILHFNRLPHCAVVLRGNLQSPHFQQKSPIFYGNIVDVLAANPMWADSIVPQTPWLGTGLVSLRDGSAFSMEFRHPKWNPFDPKTSKDILFYMKLEN